MTVGTTTGTNRSGARQGMSVGVLEVFQPNTATAVAGAATLNQGAGFVTSQALTTAAAADFTLTLTNSFVDINTMVFANVKLGTSTTGVAAVAASSSAAGVATIVVQNIGTAAFNGTVVVGFFLVRKAAAPL
jgi:hypothetical protein